MNRHDRRAQRAVAAQRQSEKMKLTFHVAPEESTPEIIAMFLSAATHVHDLAVKLPGEKAWPIHVVVEMGGKKMCGSIEPANWYPLYDAELDREGCEELIRDVGLPVPTKSACTYCPNNTLEDWKRLRVEEPDRFAEAVEMSRGASRVEDPDTVGLMRCNPNGKRQLHVWVDGGYGELGEEVENAQPCECAL